MTRVLLIGSETTLVGTLWATLRDAGAAVTRVPDAVAAAEALAAERYDCVAVVDAEFDAEFVERRLRERGRGVPVVSTPDDDAEAAERVLDAATAHRFDETRDRRQRRRAAVADVRAALADCPDREAVERTVAERLVGEAQYRAAWVGRWDDARGVLVPAAAAGIELGTLREVPAGRNSPVAGQAAVDWDPVTDEVDATATLAVPVVTDDPLGVLQVYADRLAGVDEAERDLLADLAGTAAAAIDRVKGTATPTEPSDELRVLGDTLAHELGNQLDAARVQLELAREREEDDHFEHVRAALERMGSVAADARALARGVVDAAPLDLRDTAERAWDAVETREATLSVEEGTIVADADLFGLLLENLFRNSVEHGSRGSRTASDDAVQHGGSDVSVTVGPLDDGFYVADDGPGVPAEERDAVFEWGYSSRDGGGAGLGIVSLIAGRHGWSVDLTEGADGGARFEFR